MRRATLLLMMATTASLALSCGEPAAPASEAVAPEPLEMLPITRLDNPPGSSYAFSDRHRIVVRNAEHWEYIWPYIWYNRRPEPEFVELDFSIEMVIIASLGTSPVVGPSIRIDSVYTYAPAGLAVIVRSRDCGGALQAVTAPLDVVIVPRHDIPPTYVERLVSCTN